MHESLIHSNKYIVACLLQLQEDKNGLLVLCLVFKKEQDKDETTGKSPKLINTAPFPTAF